MINGETESDYLTHTHPPVIHTVSDTFSPVLIIRFRRFLDLYTPG